MANIKVTFGSAGDLWNTSWLPADVNAANFGAQFTITLSTGTGPFTFGLQNVKITIFTSSGAIILGAKAAGSVTLLSGRTYTYIYKNSVTGSTSGLGPASASTGAMTSQNQALSGIPTNTDPQVDRVILLATADGNDLTKLFFLTDLANGTSTYTDNTSDATLLAGDVYQETDFFGNLHGVANNNPPPNAYIMAKHKGRLWMASGQFLFFSKNIDDVTTSTGLTVTRWEEGWPATNLLDISSEVESISALLSDGETLWIGTEKAVRRLVGDSPVNFQKPEVQFNGVGVVNQECWKVVFFEGQPVGTMWLTPDFRVMASDFNTYRDVGTPIQNVLNSINPSALSAIHASFVSKGPADYYMLHIPTGSNTLPDTICVFNLRTKHWVVWVPTDSIGTSLFNVNNTGVSQWLFGAGSGVVYIWDDAVFQDRVNNTPVSYATTATTSWLDFGDLQLRKLLNSAIIETNDTALTLQVSGAAVESAFAAPTVIKPTTTVTAGPFGDFFVPLAGVASKHRWYQLQFVSPASTIPVVLAGFQVETVPHFRY